jgi:hypothetical protein
MTALVLNALGRGFDVEEGAEEEMFGPVLCVIAYGLHAAILGTDLQHARRVVSQPVAFSSRREAHS